MMIDICKTFDKIMINNRLFGTRYSSRLTMLEVIKNFSQYITRGVEIILVGDTGVADRFLNVSDITKKTRYIIDPKTSGAVLNNATRKIRGTEVLSSNQVDDLQNVAYIVLDKNINKSIFNIIPENAKYIICVNDIMEINGQDVLKEYLEWCIPYTTPHERIMFTWRLLKSSHGILKRKYLEELIYKFLLIKDFDSAFSFIQQWKESEYDEKMVILDLENSLRKMINDISDSLKLRGDKNDIIMVWNDAMRFDELSKLDFLGKEVEGNSLFFENAYTTVYDTHGAFASIFNKRYQIDDYNRSDDDCDLDNSLLVNKLKEKGYVFISCFDYDFSDKSNTATMAIYDPGCLRFWNAIDFLIKNDSPVFLLIYEQAETHNPYHCPYMDKDYYFIRGCDPSDYQKQITLSSVYWDKQLKFYMSILNYEKTTIYMSDHGKPLDIEELCKPNPGYIEEYTHVVLEVQNSNIGTKREGRIFSLINFIELISYVLNPSYDNYEKMFDGYALLQAIDRYNKGDIEKKLSDGAEKTNLMSYRAIRTEEDIFVLRGDGNRMYYQTSDMSVNEINNEKYTDRIKYLEDKTGDYFINIFEDDFFENSRILYL